MKKTLALLSLIFFSVTMYPQDINPAYLAGAVKEVNNKVVFTKSISTGKNLPAHEIYKLMDIWAKKNYPERGPKNRMVLSDPNTDNIACVGEKDIVFKKSALSLDRTTMSYQLIIEAEQGVCNVTVRNIKYQYEEGGKNTWLLAEEMITDKYALNKEGTKLNRYYDKFRIHTIDSVNAIFTSVDAYLNGVRTQGAAQQRANEMQSSPENAPARMTVVDVPSTTPEPQAPIEFTTSVSSATGPQLSGYRRIDADKIPGNIIKLLGDWTLITSGTPDKVNAMTASWGGLGVFWEEPVAFSFLNPTRYSINTMDAGETYTISFYTEAYKDALKYCGSNSGRDTDKIKGSGLTPLRTPSGATAFSEAWMIIECRKILAQPIYTDAVADKEAGKQWSRDGYHKIYVGQILNVWIK